MKNITEYLTFFGLYGKTKRGLFVAYILVIVYWFYYIFPLHKENANRFFTVTFWYFFILLLLLAILWAFYSGRIPLGSKFTVVFCLKSKDTISTNYIENAKSILCRELDKLGLLRKIRIEQIGQDIINNIKEARTYRENHNRDLVIWGEVFCGTKDEKKVCDFKGLFFTCKIPPSMAGSDMSELFKTDINIALVNRDWNVYELNSLPDIEKISGHLYEIIMYILGLIYCQYYEYAEVSTIILERLFKILTTQTVGEQIKKDKEKKSVILSSPMLRKGRILSILLITYKKLGISFFVTKKYDKSFFYLNKFMLFEKKDIVVLATLAECSFYLTNDIKDAKMYTDQIKKIDKHNEIYFFNNAFFSIWNKNYHSTLFFYGETIKKGRKISRGIVTQVVAFLDERKTENRKELAYDFAIGFLNYHFIQKKIGSRELKNFVKKAKHKTEYHEMVSYVKQNI